MTTNERNTKKLTADQLLLPEYRADLAKARADLARANKAFEALLSLAQYADAPEGDDEAEMAVEIRREEAREELGLYEAERALRQEEDDLVTLVIRIQAAAHPGRAADLYDMARRARAIPRRWRELLEIVERYRP